MEATYIRSMYSEIDFAPAVIKGFDVSLVNYVNASKVLDHHFNVDTGKGWKFQ